MWPTSASPAGSTFAAGGPQSGSVANGNATVDTTGYTAGNTLVTVTNATLQFALGSGDANSGSKIVVTGGVSNHISFTASTVSINDLVGDNLTLNQEYVLIAGDNTLYDGLQLGQTVDGLGTEITGGLDLEDAGSPGNEFADLYGGSRLFLNGDDIVVQVLAAPEPGSWALGLLALGGFVVLVAPASPRGLAGRRCRPELIARAYCTRPNFFSSSASESWIMVGRPCGQV
ncbi:MAG: hypothetical protein WDO13_04130 [Verrucomicrobiota bacterium]